MAHSKRTQGKWKVDGNAIYCEFGRIADVFGTDAFIDLGAEEEAKANAEFICLAANTHDELVEALKNLNIRLSAFSKEAELSPPDKEIIKDMAKSSRELISKAEQA